MRRLLATASGTALVSLGSVPSAAAPGDVLRSFVPEGPSNTSGRGLAFDGTYLYYTILWSSKIYKITTTGQLVDEITVLGAAPDGGPLAWDGQYLRTIDYGMTSSTLLTIDPSSGVVVSSCDIAATNPSHPAVLDSPGIEFWPDGLSRSCTALLVLSAEASDNPWVVFLQDDCTIASAFQPALRFQSGATGPRFGPSGVASTGCHLWHAYPFSDEVVQTYFDGSETGLSFDQPTNFGAEDLAHDTVTFSPACVVWAHSYDLDHRIEAREVPCCDCVPPPPDLVSWWQFDDSGPAVAVDHAGGNDGEWGGLGVGPPVPDPAGIVTAAYEFDAAGVTVPYDPSMELGPGQGFTFDMWVKITGDGNPSDVGEALPLISRETAFPAALVLWQHPVDGEYRLAFDSGTLGYITCAQPEFIAMSTIVERNQWIHLAVSVDRGVLDIGTFYVNGSPVPETFTPSLLQRTDFSGEGDFLIGYGLVQCITPYWFEGKIDEVEYFSRALTAPEIGSIADAGCHGKCPDLGPMSVVPFPDRTDAARFVRVSPNPFRATVEFSFETHLPGVARVSVVDVTGRRVRDLFSERSLPPGRHAGSWDGRLSNGEPAPSGIYFLHLRAHGTSSSERVVLLRP